MDKDNLWVGDELLSQAAEKRQRRPRRERVALTGFTVLAVAALLAPTNYLVQDAGPVLDVNGSYNGSPIVSVKDATTYKTDSHFLMTTVSSTGTGTVGVTGAQALMALVSKNKQALPVRVMYPEAVSTAEVDQANAQLMQSSQDSAAIVAMELAGLDVSMDVRIVSVSSDYPSGKVLQEDDVIRSIMVDVGDKAGQVQQVKSHRQLSAVLDALPAGSKVTLGVERSGVLKTVSFETIPFPADSTGWVHPGSLLGVGIVVENFKLPAEVKYLVEGIGGPSAGNMFALGIYDQLTPGSLAGNKVIAGTGTVAWDGDVGPIGGIEHKLVGAANAGATDFLAPAENCAETIGYEPAGMRIWAVRTTEESVQAVEAIKAGTVSSLVTCQDIVAGTK